MANFNELSRMVLLYTTEGKILDKILSSKKSNDKENISTQKTQNPDIKKVNKSIDKMDKNLTKEDYNSAIKNANDVTKSCGKTPAFNDTDDFMNNFFGNKKMKF